MKYFVTVSDSSVKINGTDMYNANFDPFIDNDIFGISVNNCSTFLAAIGKKTKDTFLGDTSVVILDSTINGLLGKDCDIATLSFMQCIPDIVKDKVNLMSEEELYKQYLNNITKISRHLECVFKVL